VRIAAACFYGLHEPVGEVVEVGGGAPGGRIGT
jgi:hypothetical protein